MSGYDLLFWVVLGGLVGILLRHGRRYFGWRSPSAHDTVNYQSPTIRDNVKKMK